MRLLFVVGFVASALTLTYGSSCTWHNANQFIRERITQKCFLAKTEIRDEGTFYLCCDSQDEVFEFKAESDAVIPNESNLAFESKVASSSNSGSKSSSSSSSSSKTSDSKTSPVKTNPSPVKTNPSPVKTNPSPVKTNPAPVVVPVPVAVATSKPVVHPATSKPVVNPVTAKPVTVHVTANPVTVHVTAKPVTVPVTAKPATVPPASTKKPTPVSVQTPKPTVPVSTSKPTTSSPAGTAIKLADFEHITKTSFSNGKPNQAVLNEFSLGSNLVKDAGITTKRELAMFMAQSMKETGGWSAIDEGCPKKGCNPAYDKGGAPGQHYYGRGLLQLTGPANYKAASLAIFNDERLYLHPDLVKDPVTDQLVTSWFWKTNVHNHEAVREGHFDKTTQSIDSKTDTYEQRFEIYAKLYKAMGIEGEPQK